MKAYVGNVGSDPELKFIPSGASVASFSLAVTERVQNEAGQWVSGSTTWYRVSCWRQLGENVTESIRRGDRVIVVTDKEPEVRTYPKRDGTQGESINIEARDVGPALSRGTATLRKAERVGEAQTDPAFDPWAKPSIVTDPPF